MYVLFVYVLSFVIGFFFLLFTLVTPRANYGAVFHEKVR